MSYAGPLAAPHLPRRPANINDPGKVITVSSATGSTLIQSGPTLVDGLSLNLTATGSIILRDGTTVSGTAKITRTIPAASPSLGHDVDIIFAHPLMFSDGLFLDYVSGTGNCTIYYR